MRCSDIVKRGRQVADLQNAQFIIRDDEVGSLNESWRDIYALLCENDDDYFVTEAILTLSTFYLTATNEWTIPLPADFFKLRSLDFKGNENWRVIDKTPLSGRNEGAGDLQYRIANNNLVLVGNNTISASGQIRLKYYPAVETLSVPDREKMGGYDLTLAQKAGITWPIYDAPSNTIVYLYAGDIVAESLSALTRVTLCAAAGASYIRYYRGTLYYVSAAGQIMSAASDLTAAVIPAAIVGPANVVSLEVWDQFLYYCEHPAGYNTYKKSVLGGAAVLLGAYESYNISKYAGGFLYRDGAGAIVYSGGGTAAIPAPVSGLTTDPDGNVYALNGNSIAKYQLTTALAIAHSWTLDTDANALGPWNGYYLPTVGFQAASVSAISSYEDTTFTYPTNLLPEIISFQCGADFLVKQKGDPSALMARRNEKLAEFLKYSKRDSYEVERINQYYTPRGGLW